MEEDRAGHGASVCRDRTNGLLRRRSLLAAGALVWVTTFRVSAAEESGKGQAGGSESDGKQAAGGSEKKPSLSPEEKMNQRFPQPVKVSFLIGLPMLDESNSTLGRVASVERTPAGKIRLVIAYGGFAGIGERPVAVPVEVVAMLGRAVAAVDMPAAKFRTAPTWVSTDSRAVDPTATIQVAVMRRSL